MANQVEILLKVASQGGEVIEYTQKQIEALANASSEQRVKMVADFEALNRGTQEATKTTEAWTASQQRAAMAMSAAHESALKYAQSSGELGMSFATLTKGALLLVGAIAGVGYGFGKIVGNLLDYVEGLEKAHASTGVSVELWQKLIKTGDQVGISFDQMRGSVERMEKAIEGEGTALRRFGIDVADFQGLKPDDALRAMAEQMVAIQDPMVKAAAEMAVFGKSGAEVDIMLRKIVDGSVNAQRALGTDTVTALGRAKDSIEAAQTAWKGLYESLLASITLSLPIGEFFGSISSGLTMIAAKGGPLRILFAQWAGALEALRTGNLAVGVATTEMLLATEKQAKQAPVTSAAVLAMTETVRQLRAGLEELVPIWAKEEAAAKKNAAEQKRAAKEAEQVWLKANKEIADDLAARTREHVSRYKEDAAAALTEVERRIAAEKKLATEVLRSRERMEEADANYFQRVIDGASRSSDTQVEQAKRVLAEVLARRAEMLAAHEETNASMLKSDEALAVAKKNLDEAELKLKIQHFTMIADSASSILRSLFGKSKAAAIVAVLIDAAAAIVKCFSQFGFWGFVPAAAVAVATGAEIAKIKNAEPAGFAQGTPGTSFVDFGAGTATVLHGQEAVVTQGQGETLAEMLEEAIKRANRQSGGGQPGGRPIRIDNHIHLDGREIGYDMSRRSRAGLLPLRVS